MPVISDLPLARHTILDTRQPDEAHDRMGELMGDHTLRLTGPADSFRARLHVAGLGPLNLCYLDYGSGVRVDHDHADTTYQLIIPIEGAFSLTVGNTTTIGTPSVATMICPREQVRLYADDACPQLMLYLTEPFVDATLHQLLGRPPRHPVRFDHATDVTTPSMRAWRGLVDLARSELDDGGHIVSNPLARRQLEHLLTTGLLLALPHNHSEALHDQQVRTSTPRLVRQAEDLIHEHAAEPLTVPEIAAAVGVGVRALQQGFRHHLGTTPSAYLQHVRLAGAHSDLLASAPEDGVTVTEVASRWGFVHLSRFAQTYKAAYGQAPSHTLRARQRAIRASN